MSRRRRRRPSTPLAILAGACAGLMLSGILRDLLVLAALAAAVATAAAVIQVRRVTGTRREAVRRDPAGSAWWREWLAAELPPGACGQHGYQDCPACAPAAPAPPAPRRQPYGRDPAGQPVGRCPAVFGRLRCTGTEQHPERGHRNGSYRWGAGPPTVATIRAAGLGGAELADALRATLRADADRLSSRIDPPAGRTGGAA